MKKGLIMVKILGRGHLITLINSGRRRREEYQSINETNKQTSIAIHRQNLQRKDYNIKLYLIASWLIQNLPRSLTEINIVIVGRESNSQLTE